MCAAVRPTRADVTAGAYLQRDTAIRLLRRPCPQDDVANAYVTSLFDSPYITYTP